MGSTYSSLLLKGLFFPLLKFLFLSFIFLPPLLFPTFSPFFFFFFFFFFLFLFYFFYHKWFVYISIVQTIHISLFFFITLFKFYKNMCKEMCTNHDLFFLLVDINLNHNKILYFFITLLILYW
jgi:hypothetical protein